MDSIVSEAVLTGLKVGAGHKFWETLSNEEVFRKVVDFVNDKFLFNVVVDYSRSLVDMIKAGNYDWHNNDITEDNFSFQNPINREGRYEHSIILLNFDKEMKSDEIISKINKMGYCPANTEQLLALGEIHDLQGKFPIIALNSVWRDHMGRRRVMFIDQNGSARILGLTWFDYRWPTRCYFAAVYK